MNLKKISALALTSGAAVALIAAPATAAVTFDAANGTGFVGKGDVQLALGLNNSQIQRATISITSVSTVVMETSWECTNSRNEKVQERERTTTVATQGVVTTVARVKNQITGYNLGGYSSSSSEGSGTDGPAVDSCPDSNGNWSLTSPAGEAVEITNSLVLTVSDGTTSAQL